MITGAQWFAFSGVLREAVFGRLGLVDHGGEERLHPGVSSYAVTPSGWIVVVYPASLPPEEVFETLSADGHALICCFDEEAMFSVAHGYQKGELLWSVLHGEETAGGGCDLEASGALPREFAAVSDRLMEQQARAARQGRAADHLFRAPMELCFDVCGFRADVAGDERPIMTRLGPPSRPLRRRRLAQAFGVMGG